MNNDEHIPPQLREEIERYMCGGGGSRAPGGSGWVEDENYRTARMRQRGFLMTLWKEIRSRINLLVDP